MTKSIKATEGGLYTNLKQVGKSFQFDNLCPQWYTFNGYFQRPPNGRRMHERWLSAPDDVQSTVLPLSRNNASESCLRSLR